MFIRQPQVRQQLFLVDGRNCLDRLDLHDDKVLHDQACPESHLNPCVVMHDGNRRLSDYAQSSGFQVVGQHRFLGRLQQARPEARVKPKGRIHPSASPIPSRRLKNNFSQRRQARQENLAPLRRVAE